MSAGSWRKFQGLVWSRRLAVRGRGAHWRTAWCPASPIWERQKARYMSTMETSLDPHEVLGVARGASSEEVRKAYLDRAKQLHPDANQAPDAARRFQQLRTAYEALHGGGGSAPAAGAAARHDRPAGAGAAQWGRDPMGSGMHYEEFRRFHEERRRTAEGFGAGLERDEQASSSMWRVLSSRRGWIHGGLVHRTVHRLWRIAWPIGLLLLMGVVSARMQRSAAARDVVWHDNFGRAWYTDKSGVARRTPQHDVA
mmetsp:Transcript_97407/g.275454  ORF Transcript_97407/g.275454 Transcript_97407/m.275454 type:complete len:254 (+) Transcript_97407:42-803(+)